MSALTLVVAAFVPQYSLGEVFTRNAETYCHEQGMSSMHWRGVCRIMAILNLVVAPFVLVFLLIYFFMRNAEKFYHQPGSAGARRWSALAAWRLREFNELPHYLNHR